MSNEMISLKLLVVHITCFLMLLRKSACLVPPTYCLYDFNRSDCKMKPTPVFYYYKPGSRCEIDIWRGCPTYNKFDNEIECSNTCIYRFKIDFNIETTENWEDEIRKVPNEDAVKLKRIVKLLLNDTNTTEPSSTESTKDLDPFNLIETTVVDTTQLITKTTITTNKEDLTSETESPEMIITTIITEPTTLSTTVEDSITTEEKVVETTTSEDTTNEIVITEDVVTTENIITTEIVTDSVITTEKVIITTQPTAEATTTTTVTTAKGDPDEVDVTIVTDRVITTEKVIITTQPTTEATTTTVTTAKGDPDEVDVMKLK